MFRDRIDAGEQVARLVADLRDENPVVLGLPRGGVPVAAVVAQALDAPLDVIIVRKIGVPGEPEYALGALGEGGVRVLDERLVDRLRLDPLQVARVEDEERSELARRVTALRGEHPMVELSGRTALIVDDGLATGATARAASQVALARGASRVVVAVPCAPRDAALGLPEADELRSVILSEAFGAVGQFYAHFDQVSDTEVVDLLRRARES
ncbi:phosphoribosyltransferase [Microcella sp.]|uniref:phosphoribosyltransferase n=1 Tax=Microcella sp. TaxID=1913979 RepID=UPI00255F516E|nr:phosphoribosyltransferase family protein [Microcella sp.]MBX9470433.1 phosphoribosyltransferase [Microcella sp.]